jgi:TRAP-type C4-dicarboxylate transport system permease small subunit
LLQRLGTAARWLDANVERMVMLPLYTFIALMIGGEGILRYITSTQTQWGGTAAIQAFIFLSWVGCAYHVRHRSHLSFDAIRNRLPRKLRLAGMVIDDLIWLVLSGIVIYYSWDVVEMHRMLGATLEGTDSFPQWVASATVPLSWALIAVRALQDLVILLRDPGGAPQPGSGSP